MGYGLAQFGQAQVVRIEGLPVLQRSDRSIADERGGDLITFTKPELEHIAAPHAGIGNLTDHGFFKVQNGLSHGSLT